MSAQPQQPVLIPQLEAALYRRAVELEQAPTPAARRRRPRFTLRGLLLALLGIAVIGGTATASYSVWAPWVGLESDRRPTTTTTPPSPQQLNLLEPLRRPQTGADRDLQVTRSMRMLGAQFRGINLDAVRRVGTTRDGAPIVLFTALEERAPDHTGSERDTICLFVAASAHAVSGGSSCKPAGRFAREGVELGMGRPIGAVEGTDDDGDGVFNAPLPDVGREVLVVGLVPDGVRGVRFGRRTVPVRGNVYEFATADIGTLGRPQLVRDAP